LLLFSVGIFGHFWGAGKNIKSLVAVSALLLAAISPMPASATTYDYDVNTPLFPSWSGTITTDCNNCILGDSDIVSININISFDPINVFAIAGNEQNDLTATPSGIFFNFDDGSFPISYETVLFAHDLFGIGVYSALDSEQTSISSGGGPNGLGLVQLAAAAVPEPSTWAMMILGFAGIGAVTYRRRKSAMLICRSRRPVRICLRRKEKPRPMGIMGQGQVWAAHNIFDAARNLRFPDESNPCFRRPPSPPEASPQRRRPRCVPRAGAVLWSDHS
jgi:hypothetical protein